MSVDINKAKVQKTYDALIKILDKNSLTVPEILAVLGNLTYSLGASIAGYKDKGPSLSDLEKAYLESPTIDNSLMLSGLNFLSWIKNLDKTIESIKQELDK